MLQRGEERVQLGQRGTLRRLQRLHRRHSPGGFIFIESVQLIQTLEEQQIRDLLDDFEGIGNAAGPEGVPDAVNLAADIAGEHVSSIDEIVYGRRAAWFHAKTPELDFKNREWTLIHANEETSQYAAYFSRVLLIRVYSRSLAVTFILSKRPNQRPMRWFPICGRFELAGFSPAEECAGRCDQRQFSFSVSLRAFGKTRKQLKRKGRRPKPGTGDGIP